MASKGAIGKKTQDALNQISSAMAGLSALMGFAPLDLGAIRFRDPAFQAAARLEALGDWVTRLNESLAESGFDLSGAQQTSDRLGEIQFVMDQALNAMTKRDLEGILADFGIEDFKGTIKQEYVNEIVEYLLGRPIDTIPMEEITPEVEVDNG